MKIFSTIGYDPEMSRNGGISGPNPDEPHCAVLPLAVAAAAGASCPPRASSAAAAGAAPHRR